jgi:hypothetical protein
LPAQLMERRYRIEGGYGGRRDSGRRRDGDFAGAGEVAGKPS